MLMNMQSPASIPGRSSDFQFGRDNRHGQLLTPVSHFPSRVLPPPGTTPRALPSESRVIDGVKIGDCVEVRRFNLRTQQWMPWMRGTVINHRVERFHVGTELRLYDVKTGSGSHTTVDTYIPWLGEVRLGRAYVPSDDVQEMLDKVYELKKVFARVQFTMEGKPVTAWIPALITSKRAEPTTYVTILAGPLKGQTSVLAPHILPYNPETADAIRKNGQLIFWENGTV